VFDFLSSHALMLHGWADRTEAAIATWGGASKPSRERAARAAISATLDGYPSLPT
jgi:hypothetical protein